MSKIHLGNDISNDNVVSIRADDLTTHACICGATGSGKSGLILGIVEEMVRLGIPTFICDIKGDIANIALQPDHMKSLMHIRFLTPGGSTGESVDLFFGIKSLEGVSSRVSTLLGLLGQKSNVCSSDHVLLSTIVKDQILKGKNVSLTSLIEGVLAPPFEKIGALSLEDAFPLKSRKKLALHLNNLASAPSFKNWTNGTSLNINELLLEVPKGKTPVVIYSIAHLVDEQQRLLALSLFFEEMVLWMRTRPGTQKLKTCLLVDEMYGLMPPHPANPPTKRPLMTMLKQARAHGLGLVCCSQNPMDFDYKAMSNAQTWIVGRLQTKNDRARIVEGISSAASVDSESIENGITELLPRQFLLVRPSVRAIFNSRECSADLRGPMSEEELKQMFGTFRSIQGETPNRPYRPSESTIRNYFWQIVRSLFGVARFTLRMLLGLFKFVLVAIVWFSKTFVRKPRKNRRKR